MHIKYTIKCCFTTKDVITTNSLIYCKHRHYLPGGAHIYCPRFSFSVNGLPTMSRTSRRILQSENNSLRVIIIKELFQVEIHTSQGVKNFAVLDTSTPILYGRPRIRIIIQKLGNGLNSTHHRYRHYTFVSQHLLSFLRDISEVWKSKFGKCTWS